MSKNKINPALLVDMLLEKIKTKGKKNICLLVKQVSDPNIRFIHLWRCIEDIFYRCTLLTGPIIFLCNNFQQIILAIRPNEWWDPLKKVTLIKTSIMATILKVKWL